LDSFFAQDYPAKEMVIVDGGSSDKTLAIVQSYPQDLIRTVSEPDSGMYDALNKALGIYTGDAVGVLNSDDCFHDRTVLRRISTSLENTDIVHSHLNFVENHTNKQVVRRWQAVPKPAKGFRTGWMPAHPTFYVRRAVAEAVGPFDLTLRLASDYDWMLRAVELHGFRTEIIDHISIDMMAGGASTRGFRSYVRHNLEALRSRRRWLGAQGIDFALFAKPVRKVNQFLIRKEK
jgi:glycosyltransferase involved in cell wall biosynthesis